MLILLTSTLLAQEPHSRSILDKPRGISCFFEDLNFTLSYDFETNHYTYFSMYDGVQTDPVTIVRIPTMNPFIPYYQVGSAFSFRLSWSEVNANDQSFIANTGIAGPSMSTSERGTCALSERMGTHIVSGTIHHEEPWLNIRSDSSRKGTVIGKLVDGTEVNVLKIRKNWKYIEVGGQEQSKGWVSGKYLIKKMGSTSHQSLTVTDTNSDIPVEQIAGIACTIPSQSTILRYYFESQSLVTMTEGVAVKVEDASLKTQETDNLLFPEYQLSTDAQSHPYQIQFSPNKTQLGIARDDHDRPKLNITHQQEDGSVVQGECIFQNHTGSHIVVNTFQEEEPWLNLRQKPSMDSEILKKLPDGTEVHVGSFKDNWAAVQLVHPDAVDAKTKSPFHSSGWVSKKYLQQLASSTSPQLPIAINNKPTYDTILQRIKEGGWDDPLGGTGGSWDSWLGKETLYPIGWSNDGRFAYLIQGASEIEYINFVIVDSNTDAVIFQTDFESDITEFMNTHYSDIEKELQQYNIIKKDQFDLQTDHHNLPPFKVQRSPSYEDNSVDSLEGTVGYFKNPYGNSVVIISYHFFHNGAHGEGGTEYSVTGAVLE